MELREVAIFTEDVPATTTFYEQLVGAPIVAEETIAVFDVNGVELLVHETYPDDDGALPPEDHYAFAVEDLDETFTTLSENGLTVVREPAEYEWGRSAYFRDPDGRLVELTAE